VSARHQVNGRIAGFEQSDLFEKRSGRRNALFLRSVRVATIRNFGWVQGFEASNASNAFASLQTG
jgi:hypothetical protein